MKEKKERKEGRAKLSFLQRIHILFWLINKIISWGQLVKFKAILEVNNIIHKTNWLKLKICTRLLFLFYSHWSKNILEAVTYTYFWYFILVFNLFFVFGRKMVKEKGGVDNISLGHSALSISMEYLYSME